MSVIGIYLVLESPSRGVLMDWHHNSKGDWRPRFSWSGLRSDTTLRFHTLDAARAEFRKVRPHVKGQLYAVQLGGQNGGKIFNMENNNGER